MARRRGTGPALAAALAAATVAALLAAANVPVAGIALAAGPDSACPRPAGWTGGSRIAGRIWSVWWRPVAAGSSAVAQGTGLSAVPVGAHFAVRFHLCGPPARRVTLRGWMPAHRHGMNYRPAVTLRGPAGAAEGLLFHMPGRWQLIFGIAGAAGREKLTAAMVLE